MDKSKYDKVKVQWWDTKAVIGKKWDWAWFRKFAQLKYCKAHRTITPWWKRCCRPSSSGQQKGR